MIKCIILTKTAHKTSYCKEFDPMFYAKCALVTSKWKWHYFSACKIKLIAYLIQYAWSVTQSKPLIKSYILRPNNTNKVFCFRLASNGEDEVKLAEVYPPPPHRVHILMVKSVHQLMIINIFLSTSVCLAKNGWKKLKKPRKNVYVLLFK